MSGLTGLLLELEAAWRRAGFDATTRFLPGLSADHVGGALAASGLAAPREIVAWFSWHNGVSGPRVASNMVLLAPSRFEALTLEESLHERGARLTGAADLAEHIRSTYRPEGDDEATRPSFYWEPQWLPIATDYGGSVLVADLSDESNGVAVRAVDWEDLESFRRVRASSLAEMVRLWLHALERYCEWSSSEGKWVVDLKNIPPELAETSLVG
jgi:cell wall assembly regulator SMI1